MRTLLSTLSFLAVMALAFWAYRENYATQKSLKTVETLQNQIADLREALAVQRAEWAYLNRPDRLRELSTINFDRLGLLPFEPEQFGQPDQVPYPAPPALFVTGSVDVSGLTDLAGSVAPTRPIPDAGRPTGPETDRNTSQDTGPNTGEIVATHEVQVP